MAMVPELDMSFEDFLNYDFDAELPGDGLPPLDTQDRHDGGDSQMLEFPLDDFDTVGDGEALVPSCAPARPDRAPSAGGVISEEPLAEQKALSSLDQPGESTVCQLLRNIRRNELMAELLDQWPGASTCPWPKCSSKATFIYRTSLKTHLTNVHVTPLMCKQPQCSYGRPFGKKYELDRHVATAHGTVRDHKCPVDACEAGIVGFSRKDKLIKHLREEHENVKCPFNHCSALVLAEETKKHVIQSHGDYECALYACENGGASRFTYDNLRRHLQRDHLMAVDSRICITRRMDRDQRMTATPDLTIGLRRTYPCRTCGSQNGPEALEQTK